MPRFVALAFVLGFLTAVIAGPSSFAQVDAGVDGSGNYSGTGTGTGDAGAVAPASCNEQRPHDFLIRGNWVIRGRMSEDEKRQRRELAQQAVRFRTEQYGRFPGFGRPEWNARTPMQQAVRTRVFGLPVQLHAKILPAVRCAEQEIARVCTATPYTPQRLSGIRDRNTYHNGEVSNHVYGIALDIDPSRNSCCGCVAPWPEHPLCQLRTDNIYDRMAMPECWVHAFEKFGFYWLGHDQLRDTMHFEFLADPDRILQTP